MTCARYVLAGVRGSRDVAAYLELLKSAEMGGWGGDIDDAFDAAYAGDRDEDDSSLLHDESMLSELSEAAARVIESSSQASSPPSSPPMCVLPHWPCAPLHLSCVRESASVLPSPCYWLSLISSVRMKEGHEGDRVGAHHIHEAIRRWSAHASSVASASASISASPASSSSICALSHHVALEIYSNVSLLSAFPTLLSFLLLFLLFLLFRSIILLPSFFPSSHPAYQLFASNPLFSFFANP